MLVDWLRPCLALRGSLYFHDQITKLNSTFPQQECGTFYLTIMFILWSTRGTQENSDIFFLNLLMICSGFEDCLLQEWTLLQKKYSDFNS